MQQIISLFVCVHVQLRLFCLALAPTRYNLAEEGLTVFDAIGKYGVAGRPLEKNEEREVDRLAEVAKVVLEEAARDLIRSSQKRPVVFEYCGDGTPVKLKHAFQVSFAEHQKLVRSGYTGFELDCQGAFVRSLNSAGEPVVTCLSKDPRPMAGKSALHAFNGLIEFSPHWISSIMMASTSTTIPGRGIVLSLPDTCQETPHSGSQEDC